MEKECVISLHKWNEIKTEYGIAFDKGDLFSPFLCPKFIDATLKYKVFFLKSIFKRFIVAKGVFCDGVVYAPLFIGKKSISLIGDYTSASYTGFVFTDNIQKESIKTFVTELTKKFKRDFIFEKIMPSDGICNVLSLSNGTDCMRAVFNSSFDDYFNSLSKSVRQNYRTAINRLNRENKKMHIDFYVGQRVPKKYKKQILSLYVKRSKQWSKKNRSILSFFHRRFFDLMNNNLDKIENSFCSIVFIDNDICGFMMGAFTNDHSVCSIPRLAIDTRYGVYCPGLLLIIKSAQHLIQIGCNCLDLSRGKEQYKYRVGAKEYNLQTGIVKFIG